MIKSFTVMGNGVMEIPVDMFRTHVPQTKDHHAWQLRSTGRKKMTEVKIMRQEDLVLTRAFSMISESGILSMPSWKR